MEQSLLLEGAEFRIFSTTHESRKRSDLDLHQKLSNEEKSKVRNYANLAAKLRTAHVLSKGGCVS